MPGKRTAGRKWPLFLIAAGALAWGSGGSARAASYYVAPSGKEGSAGTRAAPWSLKKANASAQPGDTLLLLDGTYMGAPVAPRRSGREGAPITYRALHRRKAAFGRMQAMPGPFPDDNSDAPCAIFLLNRSHIIVQGVRVGETGGRWLYAGGASFITVEDCHFENQAYPKAWESCRFKKVGEHIVFRNNFVEKGNDSVALTGGSHHLVEGNTFRSASHVCLVLMGVQRSVIRRNRFFNPDQKTMEVFSTRRREWKDPQRKSRYLLIEANRFERASDGLSDGYSGIQYAGNASILRRNTFRRCGQGMDFACYGGHGDKRDNPEAFWNRNNRFYHNVVHDCGPHQLKSRRGGGGINFAKDHKGMGGNILVNNIIFGNTARYGAGKKTEAAAGSAQVLFYWDSRPEDAFLFHNLISAQKPGRKIVFWQDTKYEAAKQPSNLTLREYEKIYPRFASGNIEGDPRFADPAKGDFHLKPGSPCIDAGRALTKTRNAGKGTRIEVEDALFFCDGFGIVAPDVIRVGKARVKVVKVEHEANRITVEAPIAWKAGAPVSLDFAGRAPDIGAFEFGFENQDEKSAGRGER